MRYAMAVAALALMARPVAAQDFRWSGAIASGKTLEVRGVNGELRATRATGTVALVTATKKGRKSDPDEVKIEVVEHAGGVTICTVYPSKQSDRPNECKPGGGRNNTEDNDVEVVFEVQVPAGVRFEGATVNGDISGRNLPADAELSTVNGDVELEAGGVAHATTVNGSINVRMGSAKWSGKLEFTTVNGGITVELPPSVSAEFEASTVNGSVESDFPITIQGKMSPRSLRGRIGEGGSLLRMTTVNGSIRLEKGS
ncbi:MAG: DUF4097 domain-containing protein [Gemmatimonadota bacterium]|nr:DUF4097 domain-containing protein [Gemmatimonadota bacterium]MDH4347629.1 DUF4097 domain-containing protein [Gemmatimonadota bacterium]MDH5282271.1 DUF4097 domain-containing protein [Gemmatimonadota bacterium]